MEDKVLTTEEIEELGEQKMSSAGTKRYLFILSGVLRVSVHTDRANLGRVWVSRSICGCGGTIRGYNAAFAL